MERRLLEVKGMDDAAVNGQPKAYRLYISLDTDELKRASRERRPDLASEYLLRSYPHPADTGFLASPVVLTQIQMRNLISYFLDETSYEVNVGLRDIDPSSEEAASKALFLRDSYDFEKMVRDSPIVSVTVTIPAGPEYWLVTESGIVYITKAADVVRPRDLADCLERALRKTVTPQVDE